MRKYKPCDVLADAQIEQDLGKIKMTAEEHPSVLFERISSVETRYDKVLDDKKLLSIALSAAPAMYAEIITAKVRAKGSGLTPDNIEDAMTQLFRTKGGSNNVESEDSDDDDEVALVTINGKCYKCDEYGHQAKDCPNAEKRMVSQGGKRTESSKANVFTVAYLGTERQTVGRRSPMSTSPPKVGSPRKRR